MNGKCFVDTNILVYVHDLSAGEKCARAQELVQSLWNSEKGVISTQVLQELYAAFRRKLKTPMSIAEAQAAIEDYFRWEVVINNRNSIIRATEFEAKFKISFWDALILQAAEIANVEILYSEDLSHNGRYGKVLVQN